MVRTGGLQVVLIELYSVLCMCVCSIWIVIIKIGQLIIKSGHNWKWATLPQALFLPQAALKEGSDEEKLSLIWHLWRGQLGSQGHLCLWKGLAYAQRICQRMSTSQVWSRRYGAHFCIYWPLKFVTCTNWHAATKGNYISKPQCQKSISSVNPEFLKFNLIKMYISLKVKLKLKLTCHILYKETAFQFFYF